MRSASVICLVVALGSIGLFALDGLLRTTEPGMPADTPGPGMAGFVPLPILVALVASATGVVLSFANLVISWRARRAGRR